MLIEGLEGADEDAAVLQDAPHAVVDVLQHLAALSHRHGCGSPCSPPPPPLAAQTPPALPHSSISLFKKLYSALLEKSTFIGSLMANKSKNKMEDKLFFSDLFEELN